MGFKYLVLCSTLFASFISFAFDAKSFEYPKKIKDLAPYFGYQQYLPSYEDEQSDLALLVQVTQTPKNLASKFRLPEERAKFNRELGKELQIWKELNPMNVDNFYKGHEDIFKVVLDQEAPLEMENENEKSFCAEFPRALSCRVIEAREKNKNAIIEGKVNPIKKDEFLKMISQVIAEEYESHSIVPQVGQFHQWSKRSSKEYKKEFPQFAHFSKLLVALALGKTSVFMITGKELELAEIMMSKFSPQSIELSDLFRESYRLNNGNVYLTLLTMENLLSRFWKSPNREEFPFVKQLKPIINTYMDRGDRYGSWYHLWGIMLYGYVQGTAKAYFVAQTETIGSHILKMKSDGNDETQEDYINAQGAKIGGALRKVVEKMIKKEEYKKFSKNSSYVDEKSYLNKTEDFRDRLAYPTYGRIEIERNDSQLRILNKGNTSFKACDVTLFYKFFAESPNYNQKSIVKKNIDFIKDQELVINTEMLPVPMVKVIFENCKYQYGAEEKSFDFAFEANFEKAE